MTPPGNQWPISGFPAPKAGPAFQPNFPALTGDILTDTIACLQALRLAVVLAGPRVTYTLGASHYEWNDYLRMVDEQIANVLRERAQMEPFEIIQVAI